MKIHQITSCSWKVYACNGWKGFGITWRGGCLHSSRKAVIQIRIKSKTKNKTCRKLYGHDETEISPKLNKKSCLLIAQSYVDGELVGLNPARLCRIPSNNPSSCGGLLCLGFTGDEKITVCSCGHQSALLKGQKWYNILGIIYILQTQIFQCALKFFYI